MRKTGDVRIVISRLQQTVCTHSYMKITTDSIHRSLTYDVDASLPHTACHTNNR